MASALRRRIIHPDFWLVFCCALALILWHYSGLGLVVLGLVATTAGLLVGLVALFVGACSLGINRETAPPSERREFLLVTMGLGVLSLGLIVVGIVGLVR